MSTVTRKMIDAWMARCAPGVRLTCIYNGYNKNAPGTTGVVVKQGKSFINLKTDSGRSFWLYPPTRVSGWKEIEGEAATYTVDPAGHTACWRIDTVSA